MSDNMEETQYDASPLIRNISREIYVTCECCLELTSYLKYNSASLSTNEMCAMVRWVLALIHGYIAHN